MGNAPTILQRSQGMRLLPQFAAFITARDDLRVVKESGIEPPWTDDLILRDYRFCNINREHDTVTKGIRLLYKKMPDCDLWFHLVVARLFNHLPTLNAFGWMTRRSWVDTISSECKLMDGKGQRIFNPAYIVSTNGKAMPKVPYLIDFVLRPLARRWEQAPLPLHTCGHWARYLLEYNGLGDFMTNQVVTDMKYTTLLPKERTKDWSSFVMAGPGTKRGLNRLFERVVNRSIPRAQAVDELLRVRRGLADTHHHLLGYFTDLNNLANSFCEWSKYMKVVTGEGTPKQRYHARLK